MAGCVVNEQRDGLIQRFHIRHMRVKHIGIPHRVSFTAFIQVSRSLSQAVYDCSVVHASLASHSYIGEG
ncbi:hypothetical protein D3C81_1790230 [compost metagenome]